MAVDGLVQPERLEREKRLAADAHGDVVVVCPQVHMRCFLVSSLGGNAKMKTCNLVVSESQS